MTDDQALRLIEIAIRHREELAAKVSRIVLATDISEFVPEVSKADFMKWCAQHEAVP